MTTKAQRPSPDQWARLDAALKGLPERAPPDTSPTLTRAISRRADALRAALESGWRMRDLVAFFSESAGINVSPSTIQTALQRALAETTSDRCRARAKRPRKKSASANGAAKKSLSGGDAPGTHALQPAENADRFAERQAQSLRPKLTPALGSQLTQGATKRGQR